MDGRVLWYPGCPDKFVTFGHGQDVKLYKVVCMSEVSSWFHTLILFHKQN